MKNISTNSEPLKLNIGKSYYVIDALYLNDIKEIFLEKSEDSLENSREEIFPYMDSPFAVYKAYEETFFTNQIIKINYEEYIYGNLSFFSTDTGLIIFISKDILKEFVKEFNFDTLVNPGEGIINERYWGNLTANFDTNDVGIILASMDFENDFDGSGTYRIINTGNVSNLLLP